MKPWLFHVESQQKVKIELALHKPILILYAAGKVPNRRRDTGKPESDKANTAGTSGKTSNTVNVTAKKTKPLFQRPL